MDNFYRVENIEVFRKWVYYQIINNSKLQLKTDEKQNYTITYQNRVAKFIIWPIGVIEEFVYEDDRLLFYLHFQFVTFHHATVLFYKMIDHLLAKEVVKKKILLCCTGGLTTGFFAEKTNEFCLKHQLDYEISATSLSHLYDIYQDYDYIFIAPQLRYKTLELSRKLENVPVKSIEPVIFAKYDSHRFIQVIHECMKEENGD